MALAIYIFLVNFIIFVTGACLFSFLNVVIFRVPRKQSFVKGFSVCPACGHRLGATDLVPIVSWLFLRGRCRYCKARIGVRDTLVELLGGLLALLCLHHFGENPSAALTAYAFLCILTVVTFIDMDTMEIPDGCHLAILVTAAVSLLTLPQVSILQRLIGSICLSVPLTLLTLWIPGAFGGGDIKLTAAAGLLLGWKLLLVSFGLAILLGGSWGIYLLASKKKNRKDHFAFGPFLCIGMAIGLLYGQELLNGYLRLCGF